MRTIDDILTKAVDEIFQQSKQVNPNFSDDWNEGFNDGMFHAITIIRDIIKESAEQSLSNSEFPNIWQKHTDSSGNSWHACPTCGHIAYTLSHYCPDCGARLETPS